MNRDIGEYSSRQLYAGQLKADDSVAGHLLCDLDGVTETEETMVPLIWYDTANAGCLEQQNDAPKEKSSILSKDESKFNEGEIDLVQKYIAELLESGLDQECIGVITPYSAQVSALVLRLKEDYPKIEIGTGRVFWLCGVMSALEYC